MANLEIQGVSSLESFLASSDVLQPHLLKGEKTMTWDGNIFVYDNQVRKNSFIGNVPVQIKSTSVNKFSEQHCSHKFIKSDIDNYFIDGGVLLFVIEVNNKNDFEIFISSLMPSDLKVILKEMNKKARKSKMLRLEHLPKDSITRLESICKNFVINKNKQMSIKDLPSVPFNEAKGLVISAVTDGRPIDQYLLDVPQYLYAKLDDKNPELFVDKINIKKLERKVDGEITIDDKVFFSEYFLLQEKDKKLISFGNKVIFDYNSEKILFKISGDLEEQLLTNHFLIEMLNKKHFLVNGQKITKHGNTDDSDLLNQYSIRYSRLKDVEALLNIFSIDAKKLDLSELSPEEDNVLRIFIESMVFGKKLTTVPFKNGIQAIQVSNLVFGVIVYQEAGYFKIINLFDDNISLKFSLRDEMEQVPSSPYTILTSELIVIMENLDVDLISKNVTKVEYSDLYAQHLNLLVLEFIKAYDKTGQDKFINTAEEMIDWIISNDKSNKIFKINKFQILRRIRELSYDELSELDSMKQNSPNDILCGISIVLENKMDFKIHFNKLSKEERKIFQEYPIYTLAMNLGLV